ncbi:hypothetical protein C2E19_00845 [Pseudomonas sp. DTU12.3]|nr:hypothetical protein C2E19_00845 [Pseudomonas sp. DTU12.3]
MHAEYFVRALVGEDFGKAFGLVVNLSRAIDVAPALDPVDLVLKFRTQNVHLRTFRSRLQASDRLGAIE